MAINDIKISQFSLIPEAGITDNTVMPVEESGSNFRMSVAQIKKFTKFFLTTEPELSASELSDASEFLVNELEQSKITLVELMAYIKANIPAIPIHDRGSLRLTTSDTQTISDGIEPVLLSCFDAVVTSRGKLVPNEIDNSIKYVGTDPIDTAIISIGLNVSFPGTEELEVYLYVNDVKYSGTPFNIQGQGASAPVVEFWQSDISLQENDILTLRGRNADAGAFDITYLRTTLRVDIN